MAKGREKSEGGAKRELDRSDKTGAEIDALFQLPAGDFTAARNALASRLKKAGAAEEAERVKGIAKPSVSAWTVNQLYWHHRRDFDQLLAAGERFRTAQAAQLSGKAVDLREPLEARRHALSDLSRLAADVLKAASHNPTPELMRRVTTTLEAVSTYASLPDAPQPGRLTGDVDPPGFETLAALIPVIGDGGRTGGGPPRVLPFQAQAKKAAKPAKRSLDPEEDARRLAEERKAQRAAASRAATEAQRTLQSARKSAAHAEAELKKAAADAQRAERSRSEAEKRLEQAAAEAEATRQRARHVAEQAEEAAQAVEDAERALEQAQQALAALDSE